MSDFRPDTRREGVTYLGSPAQSCRGEGGTPQTNVTGACGARAVSGPRWVCLRSQRVRFPGPRCSGSRLLCRTCLKRALGCVHFPGLGCSGPGSRVVHRGADSAGPGFCALPRSEQLWRPGAWRVHSPQVGDASYHLPVPASVSWVRTGSTVSGVPCVSSGELTSGCDPPGGCQPSRTPGRLG